MGWFSVLLVVWTLCSRSAGEAAAIPAPERSGTAASGLCDVTIWDSTREEKGVQSITARCTQGQVVWRLPWGGLRIDFVTPSTFVDAADEVEVCCAVSASFSVVQLSLDVVDAKTLTPIAVVNSSETEICFRSSPGRQVALFAEADPSRTSVLVGRVTVDYDVSPVGKDEDGGDDELRDCRPCSDDELLLAVCTADFAVEGRMLNVTHGKEWTTIDVQVGSVVHQSKNFADFLTSLSDRRDHRDDTTPVPRLSDVLGTGTRLLYERSASGRHVDSEVVPVSFPSRCRVHRGDGLFLFVGRVRLRRTLLMRCAPRVEEFWNAWSDAVRRDENPCVLG